MTKLKLLSVVFCVVLLGLLSIPMAGAQTVIASTDGEEAGLRLDVTEVKRGSGDTLTVKFTITNSSDKAFNFANDFGDSDFNDSGNLGGMHLIDAPNRKKYLVIRDSEKQCLCSTKVYQVEAGGAINLWAKFPAPPPDVQNIGIVLPRFIPLDDVPISQ